MNRIPTLRPTAAKGALLASVLAGAMFPATALAAADEAADADQPIVVTGEREADANPNANPDAPYKVEKSADGKYTEEVRDTPKSITIIPKEVLEDVGATSFRDVARTTPGVTLGTGEGGNAFGDRIFIRGFEARNDIYIDGLRDPGVSSREIFAIEQIEIVKGPNSAFGGRGTTGGSVSLQSKRATPADTFVVAEAMAGTEKLLRGTVDANVSLAYNAGLRVNALYHTADTPGRDHVDSERYGVAAALTWRPSYTTEINLDYYRFRLDGMSDYGHPFNPATQEPWDVDLDNFYGAVGRDFLENGSDIGTISASWQPIEALRLRTQTRYGKVHNRYVVSVPRVPVTTDPNPANWTVATGSPQRNAETRYVANVTSATAEFATGGIKHTLVLGGEYANEKVTNLRYRFPAFVELDNGTQLPVSGGFVRNLFDPDPVLGFEIPAIIDTTNPPSITRVETLSAFVLDTIKLSPQFEVLLGARYDGFDIRTTGGTLAVPIDVRASTGFFNGQASLLYKPAEAISLYASWASSSNPSGEQLDATSPIYGGLLGAQGLEPERNRAIELGGKWEVANGRLLLTAAAFRIDKDNARDQVAPGVFDFVGQLRSEGIEFGVNGNITERWAVFGGYSYLNARVRNALVPAQEGARFPNVPRHNAALLTSYAVTDKLTVGGQAYYRSRIHGGQLAAGTPSVPGYWKFDAVVNYHITEQFELRLNAINLFDKRYYDAIYRSGTPFSYVAPGRSVTFSITGEF